MKLKVLTVTMDPATGTFDGSEVETFSAANRVERVFEHFFEHEGEPKWALLLTYRDLDPRRAQPESTSKRRDWRSMLIDDERKLFDLIRRWRNDKAKADGRPPYVLLTNKQIYDVVRRRPKTTAELREVEGVGEARIDSFGAELLAMLDNVPDEAVPMEEVADDA